VGDPTSIAEILWSSEPATRRALWTIVGVVVPIALAVYLPLIVRATRLTLLERRLRDTLDEYEPKGAAAQRGALREWLRGSALRPQFEEFERRWTTAQITEGGGRAPIRLLDVLEDQPLLSMGPRRSLLPVLPGLFLGVGVFGALFGLIPGVAGIAPADVRDPAVDPLALQLGLALRATAWGFGAAIAASLAGRLVEGAFEARARGLDDVLARAYQSVSPGELAEITRQTQQRSLEILGRELTQFAHELNERLERGLQRIEQSSARAASLVSQEQRGALHGVVQELSLSVRQGVEHHLAELRGALQRAVDYQSSVTSGLSETYERMVENAQVQDRVARTLSESADALDTAARSLRASPVGADGSASPSALAIGAASADGAGPGEVEAFAAAIAAQIGHPLRSFTEQIEKVGRALEALRGEIHDESRSRDGGRGEARRPEPDDEAARRARSERAVPPRERSWSPSPVDRPGAERGAIERLSRAGATGTPVPASPAAATGPGAAPAAPASTAAAPPSTPAAAVATPSGPAAPTARPAAPAAERSAADRSADLAATDGPLGRELSLSGFRVGAPRAQGPDPYERLASGAEPPSNVRHFPTRDRELGDELKLSGLLGPSAPPAPSAGGTRRDAASSDDRTDDEPVKRSRPDERD